MTLKEMLNQNFSDPNLITIERYKSAKFAFVVTTFLFFVNFYFVAANFFTNIFANTLGTAYILMLLSFVFYLYFFVKKILLDKQKSGIIIFALVFLILLFLILILPLIIRGGIVGIIDLIS